MKNVEDIYTLSPMQQGMLFHTLYAPRQGVYFEQLNCTIHEDLEVSAFKLAWQQVVNRHPILRTAFIWDDLDEPLQVVHKRINLPWVEKDWQHLTSTEQQEQLEAFLQADRYQNFELSQPPLMRCALIQIQPASYYFVWSHHHLLLDGWCSSIIFKEVLAFYKSEKTKNNLCLERPRPYRDYIAWLQQQNLSQAQVFWQQTLQGFTVPTPLIVNQKEVKRSEEQSTHDEQSLYFSTEATTALQLFAQQHHLTLNTLVQGTWALLLSRYSRESDLVFGVTVSGRPPELVGAQSMVGLFINTLPMRCQVPAKAKLLPWLHQLQVQQAELQQYSYSPLVKIHQWSDILRDKPLFESIVVFENYPVDASLQEGNVGITISDVRVFERTNYPLTLIAGPGSELHIRICYDNSRFCQSTIRRMLGHIQTILMGMVAHPQQSLYELPLLTDAEQQQLIVWNNTEVEYSNQCIHHLFEAQVERTPDAVAVVFEDQQLTYRELNQRANQLAHHLQALGVKPEVVVGICMERSLWMVIGLLGILKAGGAYVPLEPKLPSERLSFMLEDTQVLVLLTQERLLPSIPKISALDLICLDTNWEAISQEDRENPFSGVQPENLAYVIYTSGSTGRPKGVMNVHQGVSNHLLWMQQTYPLTLTDRVLQKTPFSFDVSVWEFFWSLLSGSCLVIAQPGGHQDNAYLVKLITEQKITTIHFVPSMLQIFLEQQRLETCNCLRQVFCSGEALSVELQQRFFERLDCELHNLYGPTETTIHITYWQCQRHSTWQTVPMGRPSANIQTYILDPYLQPVPVGVAGELYVSGACLARGYLNHPELTAEKFIPNPFDNSKGASALGGDRQRSAPDLKQLAFKSQKSKLYKTGDLARYFPDGNIEYLGRIDNQVKIRGLRIELGEIEAILTQHPQVQQAVVIVRETQADEKQLVAYVVSYQESLQKSELRSFLKEKLPEYMIPAVFVLLSSLPLTPHGKLDRHALPAPEEKSRSPEANLIAPRTPTEETLASIWSQVLRLDVVDIHNNFFELGGHSLLATQLLSQIRKVFSVEISLRHFFELPTVTIAELAREIEKLQEKNAEIQLPAIVSVSRESRRIKRSSLMEEGTLNRE